MSTHTHKYLCAFTHSQKQHDKYSCTEWMNAQTGMWVFGIKTACTVDGRSTQDSKVLPSSVCRFLLVPQVVDTKLGAIFPDSGYGNQNLTDAQQVLYHRNTAHPTFHFGYAQSHQDSKAWYWTQVTPLTCFELVIFLLQPSWLYWINSIYDQALLKVGKWKWVMHSLSLYSFNHGGQSKSNHKIIRNRRF